MTGLAQTELRDGFYVVLYDLPNGSPVCAGFIVEDSWVTECAPILRKNLDRHVRSGDVRRVGP